MRPIVLAGLMLAWNASPAVAADPAAVARQRLLRGNLAEARDLYEKLASDPKQAVAAAIGLSRTWEGEGELDKAAEAIDAALKSSSANPTLLARRAELSYLRGRLDDALQAAESAIAQQDDEFLARWVRANIRLDRGELTGADTEFRWFVRTYTARDSASKPIKDADTLLLVAQAGTINARWHNLSDQFRFILTEVLNDALRADADFWPAEQLAGELLLEKYNRPEALASFDKVLAINPRAVPALVGKGRLALQEFELKSAEQFAQQALAINPRSIDGLHLLADVHFISGELTPTQNRLRQARSINPHDEATLGRLAACLFVAKQTSEFDRALHRSESPRSDAGPILVRTRFPARRSPAL